MSRYISTSTVFFLVSLSALGQVKFHFSSFDAPGSTRTFGWAVNDGGEVAGYYTDAKNHYVGFERSHDGVFSKPIRKGAGLLLFGLNDSGDASGYYIVNQVSAVSFVFSNGQFSDFSYKGLQTFVQGINNDSDLTGYYDQGPNVLGFLYHKASNTVTSFTAPGNASTYGSGVNKHDEVVGIYQVGGGYEAFLRRPDGKIETFSYPGSLQTFGSAVNDCGLIAGGFTDTTRTGHGFYGKLGNFTQLDYPGSAYTFVNGLNNHGEMTGYYSDSQGGVHGFIATPDVASCNLGK